MHPMIPSMQNDPLQPKPDTEKSAIAAATAEAVTDAGRLHDVLEAKGLKFTFERRQLLEEVLLLRTHFDADGLYDIVRTKGLRISRDTVYRTLPLLLECGVVQKSVGDGRREYFECVAAKGHHD